MRLIDGSGSLGRCRTNRRGCRSVNDRPDILYLETRDLHRCINHIHLGYGW